VARVAAAVTAIAVVAVTAVVAAAAGGASLAGRFLIFYLDLLIRGQAIKPAPFLVRTMEA